MSTALNSIYNSHLTGEERTLAVAEATAENNYNKLVMAYEMCCMQEQQMINDAELKVFSESGTYDDLAYLVEAAEEETGEKKKNILQKIIDAIVSLCSSISNAIKSAFGKGSPDDEISIPSDLVENHGKISSVKGKINKAASLLKAGNYAEALKEVGPILAAIGAVAAAGTATAVIVKKKRSEVEAMAKDEDDTVNIIRAAVDSVKSKLSAIADIEPINKVLTKFKEILDKIKNNAKGLSSKIGGAIETAKDGQKLLTDNGGDKAGSDSSSQEIKIKNTTFRVDGSGNVKAFNKEGGEIKVESDKLPKRVKELINKIKGVTESMTTDEIQEFLGEAYTVEFVDDSTIEIKASDYVIESEEINTENSIFGSDIENSADSFNESALDEELESLANLLADI